MPTLHHSVFVCFAAFAAGCGGNVVFVEDGEGGGGGVAQGGNGGAPGVTVTDVGTSTSTTDTSTASVTTVGVGGGGPGLTLETTVPNVVGQQELSYEAAPNTLGITVPIVSSDDFQEVRFTYAQGPTGTRYFDGFLPNNSYAWAWYGSVAASVPQTSPAIPFVPGHYQFGYDVGSPPATVQLWRRSTSDGVFHGGVIDVNIFMPEFLISDEEALDTAMQAYTNWGGMELGDVRFFTIPDQFFVIDDNNVFDLLAETAVAQTRPALNIMATGSIEGSLEGAAGFATGLPGIPVLHGTTSSAVVWMVTDPFYDPIILRHEGAHFGGLFHTSEFEAGLGDPLDDTPLCDDVFAHGQFGEGCPDYDYIMFPTGGSGEGRFSAQESTVLQASTIYRGVYAPGEPPMTPYGPPLDDMTGGSENGRKATPEELEASRDRVRARSIGPRARGTWASRVSPAALVQLEGIGCARPGRTYLDDLAAAGGADVAAMHYVALDDTAPAYVRRRALLMLARLAPTLAPSEARALADEVEDLARGVSPGLVRAAALRVLDTLDGARAEALATDLEGDADRVVNLVASRIAR